MLLQLPISCRILPVIILLTAVSLADDQDGWFWLNPWPQGHLLHDVYTIDSLAAIAVGRYGTIIRTDDGGQSWRQMWDSTHHVLRAIDFYDGKHGWIAGDGGILLATADSGLTWNRLPTGTGNGLYDITFADSLHGWIVGKGGTILKTMDRGQNWNTETSPVSNDLYSTTFIDPATGWVAGDDVILKTNDSGSTWIEQGYGGGCREVTSLFFLDADTGWASTKCGWLLKTTDGGEQWEAISPYDWYGMLEGEVYLYSLYFTDNNTGYAVGDGWSKMPTMPETYFPVLARTTDGGGTWTNYGPFMISSFRGIHFADQLHGWSVGSQGGLMKTNDGGDTWSGINKDITPHSVVAETFSLTSVHFIDDTLGWIVSGLDNYHDGAHYFTRGRIYRTQDGGQSWEGQNSDYLYDIQFVNREVGWAVGSSWVLDFLSGSIPYSTPHILKTTDGGQTWFEKQGVNADDRILHGLHFVSADTGWVVGSEGGIWKTVDGGASWQVQTCPEPSNLTAVVFKNALVGWAVGLQGFIIHTTDGGMSWYQQTSGTDRNLYGVDFIDHYRGCVVGLSGTILVTANGGASWRRVLREITANMYSVDLSASGAGWLVGDWGTVIYTPDGGVSWYGQEGGTNSGLTAVTTPDGQHCWIVGPGGIILKTVNGGGPGIRLAVEDAYIKPLVMQLAPNYPNPFNPITTIPFSLSAAGQVNLTVYDLLGRQVETLLDEHRVAGEYHEQWYAWGYASGIYILRLQAGDITLVRKVLLLK